MNRSCSSVIVAAAVLAFASGVRADLHPGLAASGVVVSDASHLFTVDAPAAPTNELRHTCYPAEVFGRGLIGDCLFSESWAQDCLEAFWAPAPLQNDAGISGHSDAEVRELPPLPGSASLFLSAMLSIGAWHLVRSARHFHLGTLPEWYHTGCPPQIGHAVPFDLDFSASPLCCFESPEDAAGARRLLYRVPREQPPRCDAQSFLILTAPRGPPLLSS